MSAIEAFNTTLTEFVADLAETFPEHAKLVFVNASLPALLKANDRAGLDFFVKKTGGLTDRILNKDTTVFDGSLQLVDGVDLSSMFNDAGLDDVSRASIWSYLGSLTLLANTLTLMPETAIGAIEQLAKSTADKVKSGEVKFVGKCETLPKGWWIGIQFDEPVGKNDGTAKGKRYFECPDGYGSFQRPVNVQVGDFPPVDDFDFSDDEI